MLKLSQLLQYENHAVLSRYERDFPRSVMSAREAFRELMKFIWLCVKHKEDKEFCPDDSLQFTCGIHSEMGDIDNMWHTFLIFTRDYQQFCHDYLNGDFFHHSPKIGIEWVENSELELERYFSYLYDNLGEKTLKKWLGE